MFGRMILIIAIIAMFLSNNAFASMEIIDFITNNNPQVIEARKKQGIDYRVDFKASGYTGLLGQYTDKAAVGVTVSVPLLDTKERRDLAKARVEKEASIRTKAVDVINSIMATRRSIKSLKERIAFEEDYLRWLQKRVEAGVDYQKDLFKYQETMITDKARLNELEAKEAAAINEALALVSYEKRTALKHLLEREALWKEKE